MYTQMSDSASLLEERDGYVVVVGPTKEHGGFVKTFSTYENASRYLDDIAKG